MFKLVTAHSTVRPSAHHQDAHDHGEIADSNHTTPPICSATWSSFLPLEHDSGAVSSENSPEL